ncbi:hypothetical protein D9758_010850 [Tetrapyrgos nigripes]|uniref:DUF7729 domain-containing protein n=1 Tax=Tetrapyrgos nigripes TaxID=182062 RepID=A0A8H5GI43_9AGAR|nr:hypothetical protein D9758_010850 [Tetrapyrgos nigripes]
MWAKEADTFGQYTDKKSFVSQISPSSSQQDIAQKTTMLLSPPNSLPTLPSSPSFHTPSFGSKASLPASALTVKEDGYPFPVSFDASSTDATKRRRLWPSLLIPLVLILIAASTRWVRHPALLDLVVGDRRLEESSLLGLHKRHPSPGSGEESLSVSFPTPSSSSSTSSASNPSSSSSSNQLVPTIPSSTSPPVLPTPFPQAWDQSSVPLNFSTQGCYSFFLNMTNSDSFRSCRSFGMLQAFSDSFVDAQTNLTLLNEVLWGTCNPPGPDGSNDEGAKDECTNSLRDMAEDMMDNCQKEWGERNEIVVQTRIALLAYPVFLSTSCLPLSNTNTYCYVSSIAQGATAASDIYLYSLPLGAGYPDSAKPSCGACERDLLGAYEGWLNSTGSSSGSSGASDPTFNPSDTSPSIGLKKTYADAVRVVEGVCGEGFVTNSTGTGSGGAVTSDNSSSAIHLGAKWIWLVVGVVGWFW